MTGQLDAVYELNGETLRSAKRLFNLLQHWHKANPVDWQGKNLLEAQQLYDKNFSDFTAFIADKVPQLITDLGLDHRAVQVKAYGDGVYRAYTERPSCYIAPGNTPKIYLYAPIDYRGQHFEPDHAARLSEDQANKVGLLLWSGGWSDPATIVSPYRAGTALPADFDPGTHRTLKQHHLGHDPARPYRYFKAEGETLAILTAWDRRRDAYNNAIQQLFRAVDGLKNHLVQSGAVHGVQDEGKVYFNFALHTDPATGRPRLELSARRRGDGEVFPFNDNAWLVRTGKIGGGDFVAPNPATAEGQSLQEFFDAIPENPDQAGFPAALLSTDKITPAAPHEAAFSPLSRPLVRHFPEGVYLAYRAPTTGTGHFTPPGAREISPAEFFWLDADESDRNLGMTLPPKPSIQPKASKGPRHEP